MKSTVRTLLFLSLCMGIVSCTDDLLTESPEPLDNDSDGFLKEIIVNAPDPILQDEGANTRNQLYIEDNKLKTAWIEGDTLGIFPDTGAQVEFPIGGSGSTATFDGGGWALKNSYKYAAYYPFSKANYYTQNSFIVTDYRGQVQRYNSDMSHLGAYDFQASKQKATPKNGSVTITMGRLGAVLIFEITVPATDTYTELDLYNDEGYTYSFRGQLNLSENEPNYYEYGWSSFVSLGLKNIEAAEGEVLTAYMMAFPTGNKMSHKLVLHGKNGVYEATLEAKEMKGTKKWVVANMTDYYIKNKSLIQAAESTTHNPGVTFSKVNGYVNVNNATNREMLKNVKKIYVGNCQDPHIMDDIGFFPNLEELGCWNNSLTHLDITKNPKLTALYCENNEIMCLDLSKNKELKTLDCSECRIANLDLSHNPALESLTCKNMGGWLHSLDVTHNPALTYLSCINNNIETLDLYYNKNLEYLYCNDNWLTSLDASRCAALNTIRCHNNWISSLNVSGCTTLEYMYCYNNLLTSLDVSTNTNLKQLRCQQNNLDQLDVSKNIELTTLYCGNNNITDLSINSKKLSKLTALDVTDSPNLSYLSCDGMDGSQYNSSSMGALTYFYFSGCPNIISMTVSGNKLTSLDVSSLPNLMYLYCNGNLLTSLDVSSNTYLSQLRCHSNLMTALNIVNCTNMVLGRLYCGNQYTNSNKTESQRLTLTYGSINTNNNTSTLPYTSSFNANVKAVLQ